MELFKFHHIHQTLLPLCTGVVHSVKRWHKQRKVEKQRQKGLDNGLLAYKQKLHLFPAKKVALELSLMDSELLQRIRPEELKNAAWTKKATKESKSPNVLAMVKSFNQMALLVPTEILAEPSPQARAKVIGAFINIAVECRSLRNYNSLKAILAGLQCTPVYRLSDTWNAVSSKKKKHFDRLCELMSEEQNWQRYRAKIDTHLSDGTPFIPFLGMFLTQVIQTEAFQDMKKSSNVTGKPTVPENKTSPGNNIDGIERKSEEKEEIEKTNGQLENENGKEEDIMDIIEINKEPKESKKTDTELNANKFIQGFIDVEPANRINTCFVPNIRPRKYIANSLSHFKGQTGKYLYDIHLDINAEYANIIHRKVARIFMCAEFFHHNICLSINSTWIKHYQMTWLKSYRFNWIQKQNNCQCSIEGYSKSDKNEKRKKIIDEDPIKIEMVEDRCIENVKYDHILEKERQEEYQEDEQRETIKEQVLNEETRQCDVKLGEKNEEDHVKKDNKNEIVVQVQQKIVKVAELKEKGKNNKQMEKGQNMVKNNSLKSSETSCKTTDALQQLKRASKYYSLNISSVKAVKIVIRDTVPNTENQNYRLSLERETTF